MTSSTTASVRPSASSFSGPKTSYKGGYTKEALRPSPWQRRLPEGDGQPSQWRKVSPGKSGKTFRHKKRQNNNHPIHHDVLLHRLSLPSSPPSGTLLERLQGGTASDPSNSDRIEGESVSEGSDIYSDLPFSATPPYHTLEPGEVEKFLESVIGAPPAPPTPPGSVHTCSGTKPSLALETHNLPVHHRILKVEDVSTSVVNSPTQSAVNSLPSASLVLDHFQQRSKMPEVTMSSHALEECKRYMVPVLRSSAQARDSGRRLDSEQCLGLLSDDRCNEFIQKAKEMRQQFSFILSQKMAKIQGSSGSQKRDRVDGVGAWIRNTRSRFNSVNTVVSDVSRRDSDITLVDVTRGRSPPTVPRAMLKESDYGALTQPFVASPTTDGSARSTSLNELVHQAITIFPCLTNPSQPMTEMDTTDIFMAEPTASPTHIQSPIQSTPPSSADFVSHLPTQSGIWFKQRGRRFVEIVDVDIEVSDDMFYLYSERRPSRLRMHIRLCSVPAGAMMNDESGGTAREDPDGIIGRHTVQWPKKGTLIVQINPETEQSKTWLPHTLTSGPLDVSSCILPGRNVFRFIQLSDLSEFDFVLVASPLPREEEWRSWDWASIVDSRARSSPDDLANSLPEMAHIPVVVRS